MYTVHIDRGQLHVLLDRMEGASDPGSPVGTAIGEALRDGAEVVRVRAIRNVSGFPVKYSGGQFVVRSQTGALKGSIEKEWPFRTRFQARVYVNGAHIGMEVVPGHFVKARPVSEYAGAVEWGHREIDLKLTMQGKVVPFYGARSSGAQGPYSARGLKPLSSGPGSQVFGSQWTSPTLNAKLMAKRKAPMIFTKRGIVTTHGGHGGGAYFIAFRRVGKTGWIIPRAEPRPFMKAALEQTTEEVRSLVAHRALAALRQ